MPFHFFWEVWERVFDGFCVGPHFSGQKLLPQLMVLLCFTNLCQWAGHLRPCIPSSLCLPSSPRSVARVENIPSTLGSRRLTSLFRCNTKWNAQANDGSCDERFVFYSEGLLDQKSWQKLDQHVITVPSAKRTCAEDGTFEEAQSTIRAAAPAALDVYATWRSFRRRNSDKSRVGGTF